MALAAEGDRWQLILGGYFGDRAPATREGMRAFAASLPDPVLVDLLENEGVSEPSQHRFPSSQWRRWDRVRRPVPGFCAVGDAVASFTLRTGRACRPPCSRPKRSSRPSMPSATAIACRVWRREPWPRS